MKKLKAMAARELRAIRKIRDDASKKLEAVLEDADWFLTAEIPLQGGNKEGWWVPMMVWVDVKVKRKQRKKQRKKL